MSKIVFVTKNATYDLASSVNRVQATLQASISKGNHTVDEILRNADGNSVINVTDNDGTVTAVYNGYSKLFALNVHCGDTDDKDIVSVEMLNNDLNVQIGELFNRTDALQQAQNQQASQISAQGSQITSLNDSQSTQDLAIEDLGQAVSDLSGE